jgi:hypothetical protein
MKRITIFTLLFCLVMSPAFGQTVAGFIDFEPGTFGGPPNHNPVEATPVDNAYFGNAYGVQFFMNSPNGPNLPYIAEVGTPTVAFVGGQGNTYTSALGCTVPAATTADKPSSNRDVGCFFLTDDPNGPGQNPDPLYVRYERECTVASGYLLDVDGNSGTTIQEGWMVNGYTFGNPSPVQTIYILSPQFALYNPGPTAFNTVGGDGEASYWEIDLGGQPIEYIEFRYIGNPNRSVGIAFDDFSVCAAQEDPGCCDGDNLIPNGSFEAGNVGFGSSYTFQPTIAPNSIIPGQYGVITPAEANTVSSQWNLLNHTNCSGSGRFMAINGRTMQSGGSVVYEQQNIQVNEESEYVFCAYYQHLPQCAFDVFKPGNIHIEWQGAIAEPLECETDEDLCGWTKIAFELTPTAGAISFQIVLDETGIGDGNDFALDDLSLVEKQIMDPTWAQFNYSTNIIGGGLYNINATAIFSSLPPGFDVTWRAVEVNCGPFTEIPGTSQSWNGPLYSTDFPGYCCASGSSTPGVFEFNKCYRIYRTVTNCCYEDATFGATVQMFQRPADPNGAEYAPVLMISRDNGETWEEAPEAMQPQSANKMQQGSLQLYPNPGQGMVTLQGNRSLRGVQVQVSDVNGKVMHRSEISKDRSAVELDLREMPAGVYLIQIEETNGKIRQEKYVKQ